MKPTDATAGTRDRIEKTVVLDAPRSRVWRALTEVEQFNRWFGAEMEGQFRAGEEVRGTTHGFEMTVWVEEMNPEHFFSFRWHPYAIDPNVDYSDEPRTLVSFTLSEVDGGTELRIVESGFEAIPESRRATAFAMDSTGWEAQAENIRKFVES